MAIFDNLKTYTVLLRLFVTLRGIHRSLASIAETQALLLKVQAMQMQVSLDEIRSATFGLPDDEGTVTTPTEAELARISRAEDAYYAKYHRRPDDNMTVDEIFREAKGTPSNAPPEWEKPGSSDDDHLLP